MIKYPDYENCIVNLAASVLQEFGVDTGDTKGLPVCKVLFAKNYKNIVVLLLDGMGISVMEKNLKKTGFFRKHLLHTYSSVFPPTTVAATTSIDCGKYPTEHAWLGWDCYYPQINENVTVFLNVKQGTEELAADYHVAGTFCGYDNIVSQIQAAGGAAYYSTPFAYPNPGDFDAVLERIGDLCKKDGKKYIYAYCNEPDYTMHRKGCFCKDAVDVIRELEKKVEALAETLTDTLLIVTADHGHIDGRNACILDYPKLMECLKRMPSIEPRALNLFVKDGYQEQFVAEFNKEFGDAFLLLSKEEVKKQKLFGPGTEHPSFDGMLGDYLAVATSDLSIFNTQEEKEKFIGVHAGLTKEEMEIPLIVVEKKKEKRSTANMIRLATINDLERVNELREQVNTLHVNGRPDHFKAGWNEELQNHAKECIEAENKDILVAERNGIICGFACVDYVDMPESPYRYARHFYHVGEFGVDKAFHRQGVATELVEFMKEHAKEKGFSQIELDVWEFNSEAQEFYKAAGFQCIRRYMEMRF